MRGGLRLLDADNSWLPMQRARGRAFMFSPAKTGPAPDAPVALTAPSLAPSIVTVGSPMTVTPGTYSAGSPVGTLKINGRDVTGQISGGVYTPTETGNVTYDEISANGAGSASQSASGLATAVDYFARYGAQLLTFLDGSDATAWGGAALPLRGTRSLNYTVAGTGNAITATSNGFTFSNGQYFQAGPTGTTAYERAIYLADITVNGTGGTVAQVDGDAGSRMNLLVSGNGDPLGQGPNNASMAGGARVNEIGERRCVAFIYDRTGLTTGGKSMAFISGDGFITYADATGTMIDMVLNNMQLGRTSQITLHRMALFGAGTGAAFPASISKLWQDFASRVLPTFADSYEVWAAVGHSLSAFRTVESTFANSTWTRQSREGVKTLAGLMNTVAQPIGTAGPGWGVIDQTIAATGLQPAAIEGDVTDVFAGAAAMTLRKIDRGVSVPRILVMSSHAAGSETGQLDDQTTTGVDASLVPYNNASYQIREAARVLTGKTVSRAVLAAATGTSDRADAEGVYDAELNEMLNDHRALLVAQWPSATIREVILQSPGSKNTSVVTDFWERIIMAEYAAAEARGAALIPLYPFGADGQNDHPHAGQGTLYGELIEWAQTWLDAGRNWTIARPTINRSGGVFTLTYASLNGDEAFEAVPSSWYTNPPANLGFEAVGGSVTDVALAGNTITLTTTGTVTALRYANQRQNVTGQVHYGFRGLVRTTARRTSTRFPSQTLYRHLPAFQIDVT